MKLVFLGTGGSYPSPDRNVSSLAIKYDGDTLLFDCGEGTQRQLMTSSLSFMSVTKIFITHFHGDHFLGIPGLIQSMNMNDREKKLEIYGPQGTASILKELVSKGYFNPSYPVEITELNPESRLVFDDYEIKAIETDHDVPSLGYSFEEKDKKGRFDRQKAIDLGVPEGPLFSRIHEGEDVEVDGELIRSEQIVGPPRRGKKIVYTGDTRPTPDIVEAARNADVLIHDSTLDASMSKRALKQGHTSSDIAAETAKEAGVDRLFLYHISPRYTDGEKLESQAKEIFENTVVPRDFQEYEV